MMPAAHPPKGLLLGWTLRRRANSCSRPVCADKWDRMATSKPPIGPGTPGKWSGATANVGDVGNLPLGSEGVMASEVVRALRHAWESLQEIGVPAAVMGGLAVSTWKHLRATQDVDLLVA